ncbi:hypothetical protein B9Z55_011091 [Caenorhabditis nigoni]|uniref:Uncharacterized protein n=1 Tax=Caenorhabditis nigoni TaxID=1611254 RepID=A0A2G5UIM0_9PELO|nr:hypothetical protein B9Z55_011091 [Caenorhabditis nigoni]
MEINFNTHGEHCQVPYTFKEDVPYGPIYIPITISEEQQDFSKAYKEYRDKKTDDLCSKCRQISLPGFENLHIIVSVEKQDNSSPTPWLIRSDVRRSLQASVLHPADYRWLKIQDMGSR